MTKDEFCDWCGEALAEAGRVLVAGSLVCLACFGGTPRADHAVASTHQVVITRPVPVHHDVLGDRPESWHLPEQDFTVHVRGTVREASPPAAAQAPFFQQKNRRPGLDPNLLRHVMRARYVSPPVP